MIQCGICGQIWQTKNPAEACFNCPERLLGERISPEPRERVELLIRRRKKLEAKALLKEMAGISLLEEKEMVTVRAIELGKN